MVAAPKPVRRRLIAYLTDQGRPERERRGTKVPLEWAVLHLAERWHQHPAAVDPLGQRPARARWFWWALEAYALQEQFGSRPAGG